MKLGKLSALVALSLVASPVFAGTKAPKTEKACTAHAKAGWTWQDGKCVKGDAANKTPDTTTTKGANTTTKAPTEGTAPTGEKAPAAE